MLLKVLETPNFLLEIFNLVQIEDNNWLLRGPMKISFCVALQLFKISKKIPVFLLFYNEFELMIFIIFY